MTPQVIEDARGQSHGEPRYFGPGDRRRFGWLHREPLGSALRDVGIVICGPFGYATMCAHRSVRHFAAHAASLGFPALRFDYDGKGDSAGDDLEPGRLEAWTASARDAAAELRRSTGVSRVCFLGVRLGGLIAARAAVGASDIAGLVLIAPDASGKAWLREMRALTGAMGRAEAPPQFALPDGVLETVGMSLSAETREAIAGSSITSLVAELPGDLLIIDRDDRPANVQLLEAAQRRGRTEYEMMSGFVEMVLDPHEAIVPQGMLRRFGDWLVAHFPAARRAVVVPAPAPLGPVVVAPGIKEEAVFLDPADRLFGVVTTPITGAPSRALVLLTSGANHHIGNGRLYVKLARRFAAKGWLVLRYDVSGIGDSLPHAGAPENDVYTSHAVADLDVAVQYVRSRPGITRVEATGLCSGAYHGFKAAVRGVGLDGITIANPLVFFWKPGMSLAYPAFQMVQSAAQYRRSMFELEKWKKLLRGGVDIREILRVIAHRLSDRAQGMGREAMRAFGARLPDDLAAELTAVVERGIRTRFVFSVGDPGEALLRLGGGATLRTLLVRGTIRIDHLPGCDHSLSSAWMHEAFHAQLAAYVDDAPPGV